MTLTNLQKAPFPWFGGKSKAAPLVWSLLGDVEHYVEPFAGSLAVLLNRPHPCNRTYFSETVNDLDGFVVNAWRAIQWHPEETARAASWPVSEACKSARQVALLRWRNEKTLDLLAGSPRWCDPEMAGWWLWAVCVQIGAFTGDGSWTADPVTGRLYRQAKPKRGDAGTREPGVARDLPHLADDGKGVNHPGTREPGVLCLSDDAENEFHPITMPELVRWFQWLSARLRHVRILNGSWDRLVTTGASHTLAVRMDDNAHAGIFLDPPYANEVRAGGIYSAGMDDGDVAADCRKWCIEAGKNPKNRIVLAGFDTEHTELEAHGWTVHEWFAKGYLSGGMAQIAADRSHQQHRERLWASPACISQVPVAPVAPPQGSLF